MIATAHALIGGAIAASISNPAIGLPLAAVSHPLVDLIPHWDVARNWKKKSKMTLFWQTFLDLSVGVVLAYILFGQYTNLNYFITAILLSEMWDILESPYWFLNWNFPPFSWVYEVQHRMQSRTTVIPGIIIQILTVGGIIFALQFFRF